MGHKTGLPLAGAQGMLQPKTQSEIEQDFRDGQVLELAGIAQGHTDSAISTLVEVMQNEESPANSRVSAATRILEFAHGKAVQQVHQKSDSGGLTINILKMSDGKTETSVQDVVSVAKEMLSAGSD